MANNLVTLKEFAQLNGWSPSYVTKLKKQDRLVMDGSKVKVKESNELITITSGNRQDVAGRHRQNRSKDDTAFSDNDDKQSIKNAHKAKSLAEARRLTAIADKEEMERDRLAGNLIDREAVEHAFKSVGATVRGLMDVFPDQTAPLVAPASSIEECHNILSEQSRDLLIRLGDAIKTQTEQLLKVV